MGIEAGSRLPPSPTSHSTAGAGPRLPARLWNRLPVVLRSVVVGFVVLLGGNYLPQGLFGANLRSPAVPWSAVPIAVYLWIYWRYVGGRWWPRSTSGARRFGLRAASLPAPLWCWSLVAGGSGIAALTLLAYALARFVPLDFEFPGVLEGLPPVTLWTMVVTVSLVAGVAEEAAFRGYMQRGIERRYGPVVAIVVVSVFFVLAHVPTSVTALPRMGLIALASVGYGILAYQTGSILPGIVLHTAGDVVGFGLLWLSARGAASAPGERLPASGDPSFWGYVLGTVVLGVLTVWAFRRVVASARMVRREADELR